MRYGFLLYTFVTAGLSAFKIPSFLVTYVWGAGLILSVFVCIRPIQRLIVPLKILCLVFSPLALVLAINVFLWPERGQTAPPRPQPQIDLATSEGPPRVYMFIFDEWSMRV
jgi:hypothetical protein